ncbi:leucine-rich repeat domain-containing protein [Rickettsia endosymbiont of Orchestes rusci]|uniref:hypothetical protein n=1 Tax=Rickettsia endosymbiont of Orchestes rusci TaxID=3066250 RepID=UPI00313D8F9F
MQELIEWLEEQGFKREAEKLRNGGTFLNLFNQKIENEGAKALAEGLKINNSITQLSLSSNHQIEDEGAKALAELLKKNNSITQLNLCFNRIGDEGAKALAEALKINNSISQLSLTSNKIGYEGAKALAEGLKNNNSITQLDLGRNEIGDEWFKTINEYSQKSDHNIIVNKVEGIVYDKPLLNHPELLKTALSKFSLKKIGEISDKLSADLVQEAINNNDDELILAGLISLGSAEAPTE